MAVFVECLLPVVGCLELGWRDVADRLEQASVVEPVDPLQRRELDVIDPLPGATPADQLGLVEADDRLGQSVVIRVAFGPNRGDRAGFG
jgi:hypothetical protein